MRPFEAKRLTGTQVFEIAPSEGDECQWHERETGASERCRRRAGDIEVCANSTTPLVPHAVTRPHDQSVIATEFDLGTTLWNKPFEARIMRGTEVLKRRDHAWKKRPN